MIQRRTLLKSGAAAAALGAPGLSALAQQTVTLKFHTFMAPQSNVWLNMHKPWMDEGREGVGRAHQVRGLSRHAARRHAGAAV
jgi:hypothetical protein